MPDIELSSLGLSPFQQKARRLLTAARRVSPIVAMTSPPTIVTSAANAGTTISNAVTVPANDYTRLTTLGTDPQDHGTSGLVFPAHIKMSSTAANPAKGAFYGGGFYKVSFWIDAPVFEIDLFHGSGGSFRFFVDGKPTSVTAAISAGDYGVRKTKLTFSTSAPRLIEVELARMEHGQIGLAPNYSVWRPEFEKLRVIAVGDSFLDYGASYGPSYCESLGPAFLRSLGVSDTWLSAVGGEGYLQAPVSFATGEIPRIHIPYDITPYAPDWIIVALGINDAGQAPAALQAEAAAYYVDLLAGNPNAIVTVFGPWRTPGLSPSQSNADAIKAGVLAQTNAFARRQIAFVDTYAENWQQLAGRIGATSGAGNSNIYVGADNVHPAAAGQEYLRARMLRACLDHLDQLAA